MSDTQPQPDSEPTDGLPSAERYARAVARMEGWRVALLGMLMAGVTAAEAMEALGRGLADMEGWVEEMRVRLESAAAGSTLPEGMATTQVALVHVCGPWEDGHTWDSSEQEPRLVPVRQQRCLRCDEVLVEAFSPGAPGYRLGQRVGVDPEGRNYAVRRARPLTDAETPCRSSGRLRAPEEGE
jgi:hypothetical protein